jgi:predicted branched-subunit amino acid permease
MLLGMAVSDESVRSTEHALVNPLRAALLAAVPLAAAIGVFGVIFGSTASVQFGPEMTIAMSLLVFSGTVQFATVGLLMGGAGVAAVLLTVVALNARNLVLGAVLRQRLEDSPLRRAALAWFMVDESFGLAVASRRAVATVLLASGVRF